MGRLIEGGIYSSAPGAEIPGDLKTGQNSVNATEEQEKSLQEQEKRYTLQSDFFNRIFGLYHVDKRDIDGRLAITQLLGADVKTYTLYEARIDEKYHTFPEFKSKPTGDSSSSLSDKSDHEDKEKDPIRKAVLKSQYRRLHLTDPAEQKRFEEILGTEIHTLVWTGHKIQDKIDNDKAFDPYRQNLMKEAERRSSGQPKLEVVIGKKAEQIHHLPITIFNRHGDLPKSVTYNRHN